MLDGNLMDYVGRRIMRKTDAAQGTISGLMRADYDVDGDGTVDEDDMVFEITLNNGEVHKIATRSKVLDASDYKFM